MNDADPHVLYVTRFVPAYRLPILRRLNERLGGNLTICSGDPPKGSSFDGLVSTTDEGVDRIHLSNLWFKGESLHWQSFRKLFRLRPTANVVLMEESPRSLSQRPLIRMGKRQGCGTILWGHFSSNSRSLGSSDWRDKRRLETAGKADVLLSYTDDIASQLRRKLPDLPVFVARNTLDTEVLDELYRELNARGKSSVREELGLAPSPTILFLGRLIAEKGVMRVIETVSALPGDAINVVVIGDGPERNVLTEKARELGVSVHFTGALGDVRTSAPWIFASDVLLNPGYLGLSVNHAFSLGVPVVAPMASGPGRMHSPEGAYVVSGENGLLAQSDSVEDLSKAVQSVLADQDKFSVAALRTARETLSMDTMIDGLINAINVANQIRLRESSGTGRTT